jgi:hypothetical protein
MQTAPSIVAPTGELGLHVIRGGRSHAIDPFPDWPVLSLDSFIQHGLPHKGLPDEVNVFRTRNLRNLWRGAWRKAVATKLGVGHMTGALWMTKIRGDGTIVPLGLASLRVVTDAGVAFIVDAFQNTTELENLKYHGYGTGTTAEAASQTALVTELTTEYNPNSTRPTGTTTEGASANIYRTVATLTPDSGTPVLREHGIFSQAATGGGTMLDRTLFAAVTLDSSVGDSLQTTYELTFTSGS